MYYNVNIVSSVYSHNTYFEAIHDYIVPLLLHHACACVFVSVCV